MPLSEESKTSKVTLGQFDALAFPHIYLIIHTNRGNPISSAFAIRFHLYLCYPMFFTLPRQGTIHTNLIILLLHTNWGNLHELFSFQDQSFILPLFSFEPSCSYPPSLKSTQPTQHTKTRTPKLGQFCRKIHSQYLSNTSNSLNTYPLPMGPSMHLSRVSKRKVDGYTMLTLASNDPRFS